MPFVLVLWNSLSKTYLVHMKILALAFQLLVPWFTTPDPLDLHAHSPDDVTSGTLVPHKGSTV